MFAMYITDKGIVSRLLEINKKKTNNLIFCKNRQMKQLIKDKRSSKLLRIRKMHIKTTMRYFILFKLVKMKSLTTLNMGEGEGSWNPHALMMECNLEEPL